MISPESTCHLLLKLIYKFLEITMDKFLNLMTSDLTPQRSSRTPPNENEISSPTSYLLHSKSKKFYQRRSLQFDTIVEMSENQTDLDVFSGHSSQEENASNVSFNKDLEEFKTRMINQNRRTVHSSPKMGTSYFEDSGLFNCSMEMTPHLETISEMSSPQEEESSGREVSFDSYLQEGGDHLHSCLKLEEKKMGDQDFEEQSEPFDDKTIARIMNFRDSRDGAQNQSTTISDNSCGHHVNAEKRADIASPD